MKYILLITSVLAVTLAAPTVLTEKEEKIEVVPILKQIKQLNDDGSYTFGFEAGDGSFKVETRDKLGRVKGKYGYVDADGQVRILEYVAGDHTGFQARGEHIPVPLVPIVLPSVGSLKTPEQKALDLQYQSVDDDQDGIPDTVLRAVPVSAVVQAPIPVVQAPVSVVQAQRVNVVEAPRVAPPVQVVQVAAPLPAPVQLPVRLANPPVVVQEVSQKQLDRQYESVDDDEDGIPDPVEVRVAAPVPIATPVVQAPVAVAAPVPVVQSIRTNPQVQQIVQVGAPLVPVPQPQIVRDSAVRELDQFIQDLQFQSVDADEDGIPDRVVPISTVHLQQPVGIVQNLPVVNGGVVRLV